MIKTTHRVIAVLIVMLLSINCLVSCSDNNNNNKESKHETTETVEPKPPKTTKYEVLNINKYVENGTTKYSFDILLPDNSVKTVDNFNQKKSCSHVYITNNKTDIYITEEHMFETHKTLYLTKETARKIAIK